MNLNYHWTVDPLQFLTNVNKTVAEKTLEIGERIFDEVVARSPVHSGSFRASWNVSVNQPVFVYNVGGSQQSPLQPPKWPRLSIKNGDKIQITNGAPYAGRIENGHSNQAPRGVVALALASL